MKNSVVNTVKSVAVDTVKFAVYPAHLIAQTTADLLNIGQAQAIKAIDGTPVIQSMFDQASWTQNKQAAVVNKYMQVKERIEKQRESNRQQDIDRLKKALNKAEGVEQISDESASVIEPANKEATSVVNVPAPPKTRENAMAKALRKQEEKQTPLMTAAAV